MVQEEVAPVTNNGNKEARNRHQFSSTLFTSLSNISDNTKRALTQVLQYEYMTKVQEATLPTILQGTDVVAKAKTGSGKTTGKYRHCLLSRCIFYLR